MKKRLFAVLLAVMMLCSIMSITAFADNEYTVRIYLERVVRNENQSIQTQTVLNGGNYIDVDVNANSSLKAAIIKACNENPTVMSSPAWVYDEYLSSLTVNGSTLTNHDEFYYDDPEVGMTTYVGDSWMYFFGVPSSIPATTYVYPSVSLLNATVTSNVTITLSFESQTFTW